MRSTRRMLTLLLCLILVCTASAASAATKKPSKTFTAVPTLKFTDAPSGTDSGGMNDITISASLPGFLTMYLLDENGSIAKTFAENLEIHSKTTTFDFHAVNDNGDPLDPGTYTISAEMVSQFGVTSKTLTKNTSIRETKTSSKSSSSTKTASSSSSKTSSSSKNSSSGTKAAATKESAPKATPVPEKMAYTTGSSAMGDEGLLIGVGVDDAGANSTAGYWGLTGRRRRG